jgi:hypothetical protein
MVCCRASVLGSTAPVVWLPPPPPSCAHRLMERHWFAFLRATPPPSWCDNRPKPGPHHPSLPVAPTAPVPRTARARPRPPPVVAAPPPAPASAPSVRPPPRVPEGAPPLTPPRETTTGVLRLLIVQGTADHPPTPGPPAALRPGLSGPTQALCLDPPPQPPLVAGPASGTRGREAPLR